MILCKNTTSLHYLDLKCFKGKVCNLLFKYILLDRIISILNPQKDWHYKELFLILAHDGDGSNPKSETYLHSLLFLTRGYINMELLLLDTLTMRAMFVFTVD